RRTSALAHRGRAVAIAPALARRRLGEGGRARVQNSDDRSARRSVDPFARNGLAGGRPPDVRRGLASRVAGADGQTGGRIKSTRYFRYRVAVAFAILNLTCATAWAATVSWKGSASTSWSNASNWSVGVPSTTDDVIIDTNSANQPILDTTAT